MPKKNPATERKVEYRTLMNVHQGTMKLNIKERCQKVWRCYAVKTQHSIRAIAVATGIPKSSVHRHLKTIERRQQYAESYLWETDAGEEWLKLLVFGVIYQ